MNTNKSKKKNIIYFCIKRLKQQCMAKMNNESSKISLQELKMSRKIVSYCAALLLTVTSVYAARRSLNSINDLKTCHQFDHTNILELLHWFACKVDIDYNNIIQLTFDPNSGAFCCHYYINQEGLLESPPWGYHYYTIGNFHQATSASLPSYVVNSQRNTVGNSARILIRVNEGRQIDQVFITQHYDEYENQGSSYDPEQTFRITTNFLRQLRKRSVNEIQQLADGSQTGPIRNTSNAYSQEVHQPKQDTQIDMLYTTDRQDDNCIAHVYCLIFVLIILIIFGSYFGNWRK